MIQNAITRKDLDIASCACGDEVCDNRRLYLHASCHPEAPVKAYYENGQVFFNCAECDEAVTVIQVADGELVGAVTAYYRILSQHAENQPADKDGVITVDADGLMSRAYQQMIACATLEDSDLSLMVAKLKDAHEHLNSHCDDHRDKDMREQVNDVHSKIIEYLEEHST